LSQPVKPDTESPKVIDSLVFLALLTFVCLPFAGISAAIPRSWTTAIPLVFWAVVLSLLNQGLLPGTLEVGTVIFAAAYSVTLAWAGLVIRRPMT
jgi:hypothetical protein